MTINNKFFDSVDEFKYNLEIFEKTLQENPKLDEGFIVFLDYFKQDILQYSSDEDVDNVISYNLPERLSEVANKLTKITGKVLDFDMSAFSEVHSPLVGDTQPLTLVADLYSSDGSESGKALKNNLIKLDKDFEFRSIRGDGHCLFRGVAAGVCDLIRKGGPDVAKQILESLNKSIAKIKAKKDTTALEALAKECQVSLARLLGPNPCAVEEIIGDLQISNKLVELFRALACELNVANSNPSDANDLFTNYAIAYGKSVNRYVKNMKNMSKCNLGSDVEIQSLSNVLGVKVEVFSPDVNQKNEFGSDTNGKIQLLFRPGHYDLLKKKDQNISQPA